MVSDVRVRVVLAAVLLALGAAPAASARTTIERVTLTDPALDVPALAGLGYDVGEAVRGDHADLVVDSDAARRRLRATGFTVRTLVPDVAAAERAARAADRRAVLRAGHSALPSGRESYRTWDDYVSDLGTLVAAHPGLVRPVALPGQSVEGRPIPGVEIASNVGATDDGRPVFVVVGLTHGREWPSGEVAMEFARDLAAHEGTDARITSLLARVRVVVLPVLNPDGFIASRTGADDLRRKNCEAIGSLQASLPCAQRSGVDLNRNFGAFWGGGGASANASDETFRGAGPWSEPESAAFHAFSQGLQITGIQSLHNHAALVLRQPGFAALGVAPDEARMRALGDAMARAAGYDSSYGDELYEVTGALEDWNYAAQGAFAYTIELGAPDFHGPYASGVVAQYLGGGGGGVREALLLAAEEAANTGDHAIIAGEAPPGRVLRVRRQFATPTSPVCSATTSDGTCTGPRSAPILLPDEVETTTVVPADGYVHWHVGPSSRPFVLKAGHHEAWRLECLDGDRVLAAHDVVVGRGQTATLAAPCAAGGRGSGVVVGSTAGDGTTAPRGSGAPARAPAGGFPGAAGPTAGAPAPPSPAGARPDRVAPRLRVSLVRSSGASGGPGVPRSGRALRVRCSEPCGVWARVRLDGRTVAAGAAVLPGVRTEPLAVSSTGTSEGARRVLRAARAGRARLRLEIRVRDEAGNTRVVRRPLAVTR